MFASCEIGARVGLQVYVKNSDTLLIFNSLIEQGIEKYPAGDVSLWGLSIEIKTNSFCSYGILRTCRNERNGYAGILT